MGFLQIIDFRTDNVDGLKKLDEEWRSATEGKRTLLRQIVAQDRNDSSHYLVLAFFDSPESAMENSNLPETQTSAQQYAALTQGLSFMDLDIIEDM